MNVDINKQPNETCEGCGCPFWKPRTIIKRISGVMAGTGREDKIMNVEFMACERCGRPHSSTLVDVPVWPVKATQPPSAVDPPSAPTVPLP